LDEIIPFIDWSPFFHAWEIRGRYPAILENPQARELFEDAQKLLRQLAEQKLLQAHGVYGFFAANAVGEDVEVYTDDSRRQVLATFHFLRQQMDKGKAQPNFSLADFVAPKSTQRPDYLGAFAVSAGFGADALCRQFEQAHDDYNSIMVKALADRLAEAFAEYLHQRARVDWGYGRDEHLSQEDLLRERYRGIRPAPGYPACPDHTEKWILWRLLDVQQRTGIALTESGAMWPGASVSGFYLSHPASKYFAVGKLGRDQLQNYAARTGRPLEEVEKWLGPYLAYSPEKSAPTAAPVACACGTPHGSGG
jgi:5-methyltetrahydrofolate--homocysteine methyltransferase